MSHPMDQLKNQCRVVGGAFSSNNVQTKASCQVGNAKIVMNKNRKETRARIEMNDVNISVKGSIQSDRHDLNVQSGPDFVAGQEILMVENPQGESIQMINDQ